MISRNYNDIRTFLKKGRFPKQVSSKSNFKALAKKYKLNSKGNLTRENKIVLQRSDLDRVFSEFHKGHSGRDKTWAKINDRFYFRGGYRWVSKKIKECVACGHKNALIWGCDKSPLRPIKIIPKPFWRIHIDLLGPIHPVSESGNKYIILCVDALTKYCEAKGKLFILFENSNELKSVL